MVEWAFRLYVTSIFCAHMATLLFDHFSYTIIQYDDIRFDVKYSESKNVIEVRVKIQFLHLLYQYSMGPISITMTSTFFRKPLMLIFSSSRSTTAVCWWRCGTCMCWIYVQTCNYRTYYKHRTSLSQVSVFFVELSLHSISTYYLFLKESSGHVYLGNICFQSKGFIVPPNFIWFENSE